MKRLPPAFPVVLGTGVLAACISSAGAQSVQWTERTPPQQRAGHAMAYDAARGVTVRVGGYGGAYLGDTWEWNGSTWTQRASNGPSPRSHFAMAYDAARGVTVLLGGYYSQINLGDTWEWDGGAWTQRSS